MKFFNKNYTMCMLTLACVLMSNQLDGCARSLTEVPAKKSDTASVVDGSGLAWATTHPALLKAEMELVFAAHGGFVGDTKEQPSVSAVACVHVEDAHRKEEEDSKAQMQLKVEDSKERVSSDFKSRLIALSEHQRLIEAAVRRGFQNQPHNKTIAERVIREDFLRGRSFCSEILLHAHSIGSSNSYEVTSPLIYMGIELVKNTAGFDQDENLGAAAACVVAASGLASATGRPALVIDDMGLVRAPGAGAIGAGAVSKYSITNLIDEIVNTRRVLRLLQEMHGKDKPLTPAALERSITPLVVQAFLALPIDDKADGTKHTFLTDTLNYVKYLKLHAYPEELFLLRECAEELIVCNPDHDDIAYELGEGLLSGKNSWFRSVKRYIEGHPLAPPMASPKELRAHIIDRGNYYVKGCIAGVFNPRV